MLFLGPGSYRRAFLFVCGAFFLACNSGSCSAPQEPQEPPKKLLERGNPNLPGITVSGSHVQKELEKALKQKGEDYKARTKHLSSQGKPLFINRLIKENSPYLQQHAHNPVNWYPWGPEALARAKKERKLIFLSVGYSTCHWCHVMEHESFENIEIARYLNEHFIAIKVDREQRPDIDSVYMNAVRALSGRGGWPMTVIMTPDQEAFFGGTYFPPRTSSRNGRKGLWQVLHEVQELYQKDPSVLAVQGQQLAQRLQLAAYATPSEQVPTKRELNLSALSYLQRYDPIRGGFSRAPKFPRVSSLEFLLRRSALGDDAVQRAQVLAATSFTLEKMARGGIYDQVAGGFHRYSTDNDWLVPHFEKMLYDNAQLSSIYIDAFLVTRKPEFRRVAVETLNYLIREMRSPNGAFYSATDADSTNENGELREGAFFTWRLPELQKSLSEEELARLLQAFPLSNSRDFEGKYILHQEASLSLEEKFGKTSSPSKEAQLKTARAKLLAVRALRAKPGLDNKLLTAWNGLLLSSLAKAARALKNEQYLVSAKRLAEVLLKEAILPSGEILRQIDSGPRTQLGFLNDYSFTIRGLLDLFEVDLDSRYFDAALQLQATLDREFLSEEGGYFTTGSQYETLLTREQPAYDGALPSGNAVTASNLMRLRQFTGESAYQKRAEGIFRRFYKSLAQRTTSPMLLAALQASLVPQLQLVIVHEGKEESSLSELARSLYLPQGMVLLVSAKKALSLAPAFSFLEGKQAIEHSETAYLCEYGRCELPARSVSTLKAQLERKRISFH